jgi:hypothetical protein
VSKTKSIYFPELPSPQVVTVKLSLCMFLLIFDIA